MIHDRNLVSVHAYSKLRGVSDTAIRKKVKDGTLIPAMARGKINVRKANQILNDATTKGENVTSDLANARKRKLVAQAMLLRDEVESLRFGVIDRSIADATWHEEVARVRGLVSRLPEEIEFPSDLAGHPNAVFDIVDKKVREVLNRLAATDGDFHPDDAAEEAAHDRRDLSKLTPVGLTTLLNNLKADKIEFERLLQSGKVVRLDQFAARTDDMRLRVRGRLLGVAGKLAATANPSSIDLKAKLRSAIAEALEEFNKQPEPEEPSDE